MKKTKRVVLGEGMPWAVDSTTIQVVSDDGKLVTLDFRDYVLLAKRIRLVAEILPKKGVKR